MKRIYDTLGNPKVAKDFFKKDDIYNKFVKTQLTNGMTINTLNVYFYTLRDFALFCKSNLSPDKQVQLNMLCNVRCVYPLIAVNVFIAR